MEINNKQSYPVGLNGQQCITPCYPKNVFTTHPLYLFPVTSNKSSYCATNLWENEGKTYTIDDCVLINKNNTETMNTSYILPLFVFNAKYFLKINYGIDSITDCYDKLKDDSINIFGRLRISNCMWISFYWDVDLFDTSIMNFYKNITTNVWIYDIYDAIKYNTFVKNNNIEFNNKKQNLSPDDNKNTIISYLSHKYINNDVIYNILLQFTNKYENKLTQFENINNIDDIILKIFIKYVENTSFN